MKFSTRKPTEDKIDINMDESELLEVEEQPKSKSFFSRKSKKNKESDEDVDVEEAIEEVLVVEKPKKKSFFKKSKKIKEPKDEEYAVDEVEEETEEIEKVEKTKKSLFSCNNKDKPVVEDNAAENNEEEEEVEEREDEPKKKKKMFSLPKIKKGKKEKEEEPMPNDEEQLQEEEAEEKPDKKKSFFKLGSKKKDVDEEPVAEEEVEKPDTLKDEADESGKKKKFFSFKKKTPKEAAPETDEPQVGLYDTEAESKSTDSVENIITLQSSQDEVRENVEPEQPVILSTSASSSSSVALPTAVSADMNISLKESIMSPDRSSQYEPLPAHDVPLPPSAVKQTACMDEASVEDVTPESPQVDDKPLEDITLSMDKPLSPRSDAPSDDISSPKAQSIAEAQFEDKLVKDPSSADTTDEQVAEEETQGTTTEETEVDSSLSKKLSEICGADAEIAVNEKSADGTQNTGMFCGCFNP